MLPNLKSVLIQNLKENAYPVFSFEDRVIPAASIWTASRAWVNHFRKIGLKAGDRVVLKLPESPAFIAIIIAAIWEKITLCILPPSEEVDPNLLFFDARLSISNSQSSTFNLGSTDLLNPDEIYFPLREQRTTLNSTEEHLFIVRSSGSVSNGRWSVLSYASIHSVLRTHLPLLTIKAEEIILSVLPWHHCFGLVLDLLPALLNQVELHRIDDGGKDLPHFIAKIKELHSVRLNGVPLHFMRLLEAEPGLCTHFHAGIVGGAPIPKNLATALSGSKLRVGYGQTEASPGICLGEIGQFQQNGIGYPVGCTIQITSDNQLLFNGNNAFSGYWTKNGFIKNPHKFIPTGDLVHYAEDKSLVFDGRVDDKLKLLNGREIHPQALENHLLNRHPELVDVCIQTTNYQDLVLCILSNDATTKLSAEDLAKTFGSLSQLIKQTYYLSPSEWKWTPKGDKNRKQIKAMLQGT